MLKKQNPERKHFTLLQWRGQSLSDVENTRLIEPNLDKVRSKSDVPPAVFMLPGWYVSTSMHVDMYLCIWRMNFSRVPFRL